MTTTRDMLEQMEYEDLDYPLITFRDNGTYEVVDSWYSTIRDEIEDKEIVRAMKVLGKDYAIVLNVSPATSIANRGER